jgi:hypothetical protein
VIRGSHLISISVEHFASLNSFTLASTVPSDGHGDRRTKGSDGTDGTPALVMPERSHCSLCPTPLSPPLTTLSLLCAAVREEQLIVGVLKALLPRLLRLPSIPLVVSAAPSFPGACPARTAVAFTLCVLSPCGSCLRLVSCNCLFLSRDSVRARLPSAWRCTGRRVAPPVASVARLLRSLP